MCVYFKVLFIYIFITNTDVSGLKCASVCYTKFSFACDHQLTSCNLHGNTKVKLRKRESNKMLRPEGTLNLRTCRQLKRTIKTFLFFFSQRSLGGIWVRERTLIINVVGVVVIMRSLVIIYQQSTVVKAHRLLCIICG